MATYQIDLEKQSLAPEGGHNYAWSNTYLVACATDDEANDLLLALANIEASINPLSTNIRFGCWRPGIGGPIPAGVQFIGLSGLLDDSAGLLPMGCSARVTGWSDGRVVWYKRWRGPLRQGDVTGMLLASSYVELLMTNYVAPLMADIPLITRSGLPISVMGVDPRVAMWQRRDGTTRRLHSVLAG